MRNQRKLEHFVFFENLVIFPTLMNFKSHRINFFLFWSVHKFPPPNYIWAIMFCMGVWSHVRVGIKWERVTHLRRNLRILVKLSSFRPARAFFRVPLRLSSMITATVTSGLVVRVHVCETCINIYWYLHLNSHIT